MPQCLFIWNVDKTFHLYAVIVQKEKIKSFYWLEDKTQIVFFSGPSHVYCWSLEGCMTFRIRFNDKFEIQKIDYSAERKAFLLCDFASFFIFSLKGNHGEESFLEQSQKFTEKEEEDRNENQNQNQNDDF